MLEWLIIGGGIHGTYLSNHLLKAGRANKENLRVLDPHDKPLAVWKRCTENTAMKYLRSPGQHNLDVGETALFKFGRLRNGRGSEFYSKYHRPSLALFNAHCDHVIATGELEALRQKATALTLKYSHGTYKVGTTSGEIESRRVILAPGMHGCLFEPAWARALPRPQAPVAHIFSEEFQALNQSNWENAVVVGGGISAAQLALALAARKPGRVTLLHSRKLKTYQFDADPCWLNARCLNLLSRHDDFSERRRIVDQSRHWGSFPEEVRRNLEHSVKSGALQCLETTVVKAESASHSVRLQLADGRFLEADLVALATGFERTLPGGDFIKTAIDELALPCAPCGFPATDKYLRWSKDLYVTGALAELAVGPASRNIIGARLASELIVKADIPRPHRPRELSYHYFQRRRTG